MKRRGFLQFLGLGAAAPIAAQAIPAIEKTIQPEIVAVAKGAPMKACAESYFTTCSFATCVSMGDLSFKDTFDNQEFED